MAKEEKPLEYQGRVRDTKGVAQRLDLDYLKRPRWMALLRGRLTWTLVALAVLLSVPLTLGVGGSRRAVANGPVSEAHSMFAERCEVCHQQAFGGVPDKACQQCHDGAPHPGKSIDTGKPTGQLACSSCHLEHRGKSMLAEVGNANCTACHSNLTQHASGVKLKGAEITAFQTGRHPEFSPGPDARPLRLNHAIHMPAQPREFRGMKLPMQCVDCHVTDRNSPSGQFLPVMFEKNCKQCHARELEFDVYRLLGPTAAPAPHTKDAKTIHEFVDQAYRAAVTANPGMARKPLTNELMPAGMWMQRVVADSERYLFERKCGYCHEMAGPWDVKKVNQVGRRFAEGQPEGAPWLERGEFAHRQHRAVACDSCHTAAQHSSKTADVLMPKMESCVQCHGDSSTKLDRCSLCHLYHNRDLERNPERRAIGVLKAGTQ